MRVDEIMTAPAITCRATDHLATAARAMWEDDCGCIPVVDDDGRLKGLITDRDLCMATYTRGQPLHAIPIDAAMAREAFSCRSHDDIAKVLDLMRNKQIRRIPVVDDTGRPTGVVSLGDIARAATNEDASRRGLSCENVVRTIAEICEPRATTAHA
jgi:CBS domain-containing protein